MAVNAENIPTQSLPPAKRSGRLLPLVLVLALLAALGACAYLWQSVASLKSELARRQAVAQAGDVARGRPADLYVALEPAFVVNFQDGDDSRYLQLDISLMAHDPATIQAVKDADPVIRNALVLLFSGQNYAELSTTAGKQKLQAAALAVVRKIIAEKQGKPGVEALYFTSFVMQ